MNLVLVSLAIIFSLFFLMEIGLRWFWGLGNPPLYIADPDIGYLLAPCQDVRRFGNRIAINEYSMRSDAIAFPKPQESFRVFLLGDSIANGAWWTDQTATISSLIQSQLPSPAEVLNASANSWGPRNQLAYLKRYGLFESEFLVLLINTDDLFASAPSSLVVGRDRNYPDRQPLLAILEALKNFLPARPLPPTAPEAGDRVGINLDTIEKIKDLVIANKARLLIAITPLKREAIDLAKDYEIKARKRLTEFTLEQNIPLIDFLSIFQKISSPDSLYRDTIHLTPQGNRLVSQTISTYLKNNAQLEK